MVSVDHPINNPKPTKEEELESAQEKIEELEREIEEDKTLFPINIREFFQSAISLLTPILVTVFTIIFKHFSYLLKRLENEIRASELPYKLPEVHEVDAEKDE